MKLCIIDCVNRVQEFQSDQDDGVSKVAREISSTVTDPKIQESEVILIIQTIIMIII